MMVSRRRSSAVSIFLGRDQLVKLVGAARQPAQHIFGADDGKRKALQLRLIVAATMMPPGFTISAHADEQADVGDVLDHFHVEHDVESLARIAMFPLVAR